MGKDNLCKRLFGVFTALWLIADMAFDILQLIEYSGEECLQKRGKETCYWYFKASLLAFSGPVIAATAIGLLIFFRKKRSEDRESEADCEFLCLFWIGVPAFCIIYALSPLFHIVQALCDLFGCKPESFGEEGEGDMEGFRKFTSILKLAEQIFEVIYIIH